jgi:serine/threonine protein kinase
MPALDFIMNLALDNYTSYRPSLVGAFAKNTDFESTHELGHRELRMAEKQSATGKTIVNASLVRDYVDGKLDSVMQSKVAAFLEKHPKLLEQAAAMSGDGFLDRVRAVQVESGTPDQSLGPRSVSMAPDASPGLPAGDSKPSDIPAELNDFAGYEIVKELGRGGMGVVYLAKNVNMGGRLEVLKVLNDRLVSVPEAKERFLREISSVAMLNHPSIVTAYSVLPLSNMLVFSMEYVQGTDLHKFIRQNNPLPIALACSIAQQIASGLQHGHERGLVHRDIKPSNIMIFRSGKKLAAKILDYGLAKATSEKASDGLTQNGMMLGTPEYIAPEQMLNAANSTICADIYSLGCTLYHMLSGQPPFKGTVGEVMMAHAQIEAPMIHLIRTDVPIELSTVIAKMMAKDPSRRYQTPGELIAVLKPFTNKPATVIAQTELPGPVDASTRDTDGIAARADLDTSVEAKRSELLSILSQPRQTKAKLNKKPTLFGKQFSNRNSGVGITTGLILLLGMGAIWFSGILTVKTANGTLVIENLPSDADVTVDGDRVNVTWAEGKESAELLLKPGAHDVEVRRGDLVVAGKTVTLGSNSVERWTVSTEVAAIHSPNLAVAKQEDSIPYLDSTFKEGAVIPGTIQRKGEAETIGDFTLTILRREESTIEGWYFNQNRDGIDKGRNVRFTGRIDNDNLHIESDKPIPFVADGKITGSDLVLDFNLTELIGAYTLTAKVKSLAKSTKAPEKQVNLNDFFPLGAMFEGDWALFDASQATPTAKSLLTVTVTERTSDRIDLKWQLHTWDDVWLFRGKLKVNSANKVVFYSNDLSKIDGKSHPNEGNAYVEMEFDANGETFKGITTYKNGGRSEFNASQTSSPKTNASKLKIATKESLTPTILRNDDGLPNLSKPIPSDKALRVVDLMPLIDVERDALQGKWMRNGSTILSDDNHRARLRIPYKPPMEYDYHVVFTRVSGKECVSLLASHESSNFLFMLGGWTNTVAGFGDIGGNSDRNPTTIKADRIIRNGQKYDVTVFVRNQRVAASVNGHLVADYETDYSDMSLIAETHIGPETLGLFTYRSPSVFHTVEIAEITGEGQIRN